MERMVRLISLEKGKNDNLLIFKGYFDDADGYTIQSVEYCGTEVNGYINFSYTMTEDLRTKLIKDFGYPPFDFQKCKKTFGSGKDYRLKG